MGKKSKLMIGLFSSLIICLFGVYRLIAETPAPVDALIIPIAFTVTGFIGFIGNLIQLQKLKNKPS